MSELLPGRSFDRQERGRIRSALRRYMEESRIGTPTLRYQIVSADVPRHRHLPLSTLQRFLADRHHTQDHHVELCHAFVKDLPYYGEGSDITQLGAALFEFLVARSDPERDVLLARLKAELAGTYELYFYKFGKVGELPYPPQKDPHGFYGSLTLTAVERQPFLHAIEAFFVAPESSVAPERRRVSEGVMVLTSSNVYLMLRDTLTRQPKLCCLTRRVPPAGSDDVRIFEGETLMPLFLADMAGYPGLAINYNMQMFHASPAEST